MMEHPLASRPMPAARITMGAPRPWRLVGHDHYTLIEPVQGPYVDPSALKSIREFYPDAVPIWRKQAWSCPDGHVRVFVCAGLGRFNPSPQRIRHDMHVEVPAGYDGPVPNQLEFWWRIQQDGKPDVGLPFDLLLAASAREAYDTRTAEEHRREVTERSEAEKAVALASHERETEARERSLHAALATVWRTNTFDELVAQFHARRTPQQYAFLRR